MLELYNFSNSTCSQKVRFVLAEKDLEWVDKRLDSRRGEHLKPDYLAINPNGLVPSLIHDDAIILDASVIMEYLDEIFHDVSMVPENPVSRAHLRKWLRYMEEIPTPAIRYPSFQKYLIRSFKHLDDEAMRVHYKGENVDKVTVALGNSDERVATIRGRTEEALGERNSTSVVTDVLLTYRNENCRPAVYIRTGAGDLLAKFLLYQDQDADKTMQPTTIMHSFNSGLPVPAGGSLELEETGGCNVAYTLSGYYAQP